LTKENLQIKEKVLSFLCQFVEDNYKLLEGFSQVLWETTSKIILQDNESLSILAIEVWTSIATQEKNEPVKTYVRNLGALFYLLRPLVIITKKEICILLKILLKNCSQH